MYGDNLYLCREGIGSFMWLFVRVYVISEKYATPWYGFSSTVKYLKSLMWKSLIHKRQQTSQLLKTTELSDYIQAMKRDVILAITVRSSARPYLHTFSGARLNMELL